MWIYEKTQWDNYFELIKKWLKLKYVNNILQYVVNNLVNKYGQKFN